METVILGWYVMVETGSVLWLTAFGSLLLLGTLVSPMFGVLGDRLGARVMLVSMRAIYASLAAFVLALTLTGNLTPSWVLVVATLAGIVRPNEQVMRNTLIGETIRRDIRWEPSGCRAPRWTARASSARSPAPSSRRRSASSERTSWSRASTPPASR